jgi:hypothetical protein
MKQKVSNKDKKLTIQINEKFNNLGITAVGIRHADHIAQSIRKIWHQFR